MEYWVIDIKVKVLPQSSLPQDGSTYYYGRSIVPDTSKNEAISRLTAQLESEYIIVDEVLNAVPYQSKLWDSEEDEDFETNESFESAKETGEIELGCFASELSMED